MELALPTGSERTFFQGRDHRHTWNATLRFRNSIKLCQLSQSQTFVLASRQDLVDRLTSAVVLGR